VNGDREDGAPGTPSQPNRKRPPGPQPLSTEPADRSGVAAATCPYCQAYTSTGSGYCDVCRRPLQGAPTSPAHPPAQVGAYSTYGLPQGAPRAPYGHGPPPYGYPPPAYGAAPGYGPSPPLPGYAAGPYMQMPFLYTVALTSRAAELAKSCTGARVAAGVVDALLVLGVWSRLFFIVYPSAFGFFSATALAVRIPITLSWLVGYYALQDGYAGATPGKRLCGLRVVDINLRLITPGQGLLRSLEVFVWIIGGGVILLIIQIYFVSSNGQGIGDRLAKSFVVERSNLALR
jgi:uncharacterized RDD family membrane protein YckC